MSGQVTIEILQGFLNTFNLHDMGAIMDSLDDLIAEGFIKDPHGS